MAAPSPGLRTTAVAAPAKPILASGAVVTRLDPVRGTELLVIHRKRYDDWTLPKGKLEPGESLPACAVREVAEETGLVCELGDELPSVRYLDGKGRLKLVRYWSMRPTGLEPWAPNDEIDGRRWVPLDAAAELLTYGHDRVLLKAFTDGRDRGPA